MLFEETVEPATLGLLKELMTFSELKQFRLVGGTALSLLYGHRASIDLDLFTDEGFDVEPIVEKLTISYPTFSYEGLKSTRLFFAMINNVKVDFVNTFERFFQSPKLIDGIRLASVDDIIALKLNAISGRGAKKDFWDLHELLTHYSIDEMLGFYSKRYPNNSPMMVLKSTTYFVDADKQLDPICFKKHSWESIKKEITKKINQYVNNR